jgi:hypothetical protein
MKYFFTAVWALICVGFLAYSHINWNKQTAAKTVGSEPALSVAQEANDINMDSKYIELAANWPEAAKAQFKQALAEQKPFKILFVGSTAMEWEKNVTQNISESFGSDKVITAIHTYDLTTEEIIRENKQLELAAEQAQLIVIEPFLLNDNGHLKIDVTLANITKMMEDIKAGNPDTTFILQPSYPIYLPKYYSVQTEALKEYAAVNNLTYLDHWTAWPATDHPDIQNYLNEDQSAPNELGYQAWAQYLSAYFIKK